MVNRKLFLWRARLIVRLPIVLILTVIVVLDSLSPFEINLKWGCEYGWNVARKCLAEILEIWKSSWNG